MFNVLSVTFSVNSVDTTVCESKFVNSTKHLVTITALLMADLSDMEVILFLFCSPGMICSSKKVTSFLVVMLGFCEVILDKI